MHRRVPQGRVCETFNLSTLLLLFLESFTHNLNLLMCPFDSDASLPRTKKNYWITQSSLPEFSSFGCNNEGHFLNFKNLSFHFQLVVVLPGQQRTRPASLSRKLCPTTTSTTSSTTTTSTTMTTEAAMISPPTDPIFPRPSSSWSTR